jgi:DNA-binding MarR family transcriptional regulator
MLKVWREAHRACVRSDDPDLTSRQLAVLMSVYLEPRPQTVRSLAKKLDVTKAVITRAITRLAKLGYVKRAPDPQDKRSIILTRTPNGIHYLTQFAEIIQTEMSG